MYRILLHPGPKFVEADTDVWSLSVRLMLELPLPQAASRYTPFHPTLHPRMVTLRNVSRISKSVPAFSQYRNIGHLHE